MTEADIENASNAKLDSIVVRHRPNGEQQAQAIPSLRSTKWRQATGQGYTAH